MNREAIYSALFDRVRNIEGLVTASRVLKNWESVTPSEQPALFQIQGGEMPVSRTGLPTTWKFIAAFYLYCNAGSDAGAIPAIEINRYLDAITEALKPDKITGLQTLGGLVDDVKFGEKFETDEGLLGAQAIAIIPVILTVTEE